MWARSGLPWICALPKLVRDTGAGPVDVDFGGWSLVDEPKEGIVSFTFDDAWADDLVAARMMGEHKMRGTACTCRAP